MNRPLPPGIAEIRALLLAGHPDVEGLCVALADWSGEIRLIEKAMGLSRSPSPVRQE
jgi:hypothetical protein